MDVEQIRGSGHHLAITAAFRMLVSRVAELADPDDAGKWFTALGQDTFDYVDRTTNPNYDDETMRAVKESAYDTLRMMFDPAGSER
jgi:hypothetical protein